MKTIAIVGRPNVGKSRLFNRIVGRRLAIVDDQPGVTRDRIEQVTEWRDEPVRWIDTGGIGLDDPLAEQIALQAAVAIEAADAIILVTDVREGLMPLDREVARRLRGVKPVVVAANKADETALEASAAEFGALGFEPVLAVSAEHGRGVTDLVECAVAAAAAAAPADESACRARIALVGRPNVGKSTLLNALLGRERVIVSPVPGTTRDAIEAEIPLGDETLLLVDTAGIRRKRRGLTMLETAMVSRTRQALDRSDVGIVLADAAEGVTEQDLKIVKAVLSFGKGAVLALNKWDAVPDKKFDAIVDRIRFLMGAEHHVPIVAISALKKLRITRLLDQALQVQRRCQTRLKTSVLNRIIGEVAPRAPRGLRIKYAIQKSQAPPTFLFFGAGRPVPSFLGFVRNAIRAAAAFEGVPIVIEFRR